MLTGLLTPSGGVSCCLMMSRDVLLHEFTSTGNAYLYDLNIKEHMDEIRTFLGVCPQVRNFVYKSAYFYCITYFDSTIFCGQI